MTNFNLPGQVWEADADALTDEQHEDLTSLFGATAAQDVVTLDVKDMAFMLLVNRDGQSLMRLRCSAEQAMKALRQMADGIELDMISAGNTIDLRSEDPDA